MNIKSWNLKLNLKKTEYMVMCGTRRDHQMEEIHGSTVKCCQTYKYLRPRIWSQGVWSKEVKHRLGKGETAIRWLHSGFVEQKYYRYVKIM